MHPSDTALVALGPTPFGMAAFFPDSPLEGKHYVLFIFLVPGMEEVQGKKNPKTVE